MVVQAQEEAVVALSAALGRLLETMDGAWLQVEGNTRAFVRQVAEIQRECANKVAALEAILSAREGDDPELRHSIARAREAQRLADKAMAAASDGQQLVAASRRAAVQSLDERIAAARADLARRGAVMHRYEQTATTGTSAQLSGNTATVGSSHSASQDNLARHGVTDVELAGVDYSDNPIDGFGKGGADVTDYRWAIETWETTVRPGVADGMTRDDFEARDQARGARPFRRTADVYDLMLGDSDLIVYSQRSSGSLDVINGRHRIEVARQLGITHLPGRIVR